MKSIAAVSAVLVSLASAAVAVPIPHPSRHDCCTSARGCGALGDENHGAETWQGITGADSCINQLGDGGDYWCFHQFGPQTFVIVNTTDNDGFSPCGGRPEGDSSWTYETLACGVIWCANTGGSGWYKEAVEIQRCPGSIQGDSTGLTCYTDLNGDDRYTSGDIVLESDKCGGS